MAISMVEEEPQTLPLLYKTMDECTKRMEAQDGGNKQLLQIMRTLTEAYNRHAVASYSQPHTG